MTARVLPVEEWGRLVGTEAEPVIGLLCPDSARVVVVEDADGTLVGCHLLQPVLHAECLWIHPAHRGRASVARRLWARVQREVRETFGVGSFVTATTSDEVRRLLAKVGADRIGAEFYVVNLKGAQ